MKLLKNKYLLIVFVLLGINGQAQVNLDSLWGVWIDDRQEDTVRLKPIFHY